MKKLLNLQSSFPSIDTSWKDKTPIISTETVRMVTNLSKTFLQIQSIFIVSNQNKWFLSAEDHDIAKRNSLYSKDLAKLSPRTQKLYQIRCIFYNPMWSLIIHPFYTNWLAPTETIGLQWICRSQLFIQTIRLHCCLAWNYITSLLHIPEGN